MHVNLLFFLSDLCGCLIPNLNAEVSFCFKSQVSELLIVVGVFKTEMLYTATNVIAFSSSL